MVFQLSSQQLKAGLHKCARFVILSSTQLHLLVSNHLDYRLLKTTAHWLRMIPSSSKPLRNFWIVLNASVKLLSNRRRYLTNSQISTRLTSASTSNASYRMVLTFHYAMIILSIQMLSKRSFVQLSRHANRLKKVVRVTKTMKVLPNVKHKQTTMKKWRPRSSRSKKSFSFTVNQISGISTNR